MNEKLIEGYLAYTDAEEYSSDTLSEAPGTATVTITIASFVGSAQTYNIAC